jgi:uncharacterized lipoprotein YmbA
MLFHDPHVCGVQKAFHTMIHVTLTGCASEIKRPWFPTPSARKHFHRTSLDYQIEGVLLPERLSPHTIYK